MFGNILSRVYSPVPTDDEPVLPEENPSGLQTAARGKAAAMKETLSGLAGKLTRTAEPEPEPTWFEQATNGASEEMDEMCSLSWKQRLMCFAICGAIGFVLSFGSFLRFMKALGGNPVPFAKVYSLGNIISLCATGFLVGAPAGGSRPASSSQLQAPAGS
eukprot:TRINITY_DN5377_c0_g1_i2.p2 TRINITY_DN5377_c0_g1~~TRINITY_DN5377_c0_g1_i2.p2  ORF type:complete len:160 (+),score=37.95 TRINITY_DN5377_c0_g1_i2:215-694(+)